jgi:O-antigen ligase
MPAQEVALLAGAAVYLGALLRPRARATFEGWKGRLGDIMHLGRERGVWRDLGGRTRLWQLLLKAIRKRPLLGCGHWAFWSEKRNEDLLQTLRWGPGKSHSIYLEAALGTGLVGLSLFLMILAVAIAQALTLPAPAAVFLCGFIFMVAVEGVFESVFLMPNFAALSFFLLLFAAS